MSEQYTTTTDEVRTWYMETYSGPDGRRGLAFDSWLAKRDAEVAEKAWELCDETITEHLVGNTAITAAIASGWPENPYRKAVQS